MVIINMNPARLSVPLGRDNEKLVNRTEPGRVPGFIFYKPAGLACCIRPLMEYTAGLACCIRPLMEYRMCFPSC